MYGEGMKRFGQTQQGIISVVMPLVCHILHFELVNSLFITVDKNKSKETLHKVGCRCYERLKATATGGESLACLHRVFGVFPFGTLSEFRTLKKTERIGICFFF
jgi:hypothetical protein